MAGKKICIYIKNDTEKDIVKLALQQYRDGIASFHEPSLSPTQQLFLDKMNNLFQEYLGKQKISDCTSIDGEQKLHNYVDFDKKFGLIDED